MFVLIASIDDRKKKMKFNRSLLSRNEAFQITCTKDSLFFS